MDYEKLKLTMGVLATVGLYSILYRENKFYRFWEHVFLGLAAGWAMVALWTETLYENWWLKITGRLGEGGAPDQPGYWLWILLLPLGLMGYFVVSKKHSWVSRIPIGIIIGLWSGQQIEVWWRRYGPQMLNSMKPVIPTTWERMTVPGTLPEGAIDHVYPTEALSNLVFVCTLIAVMSYFIFSVDFRHSMTRRLATSGRYLLMIGFGAIFGSTVMMRFTLLIDRMYFVWIEWLMQGMLGRT